MTTQFLGRRLVVALGLGLVVFAGLGVYADINAMRQAVLRFPWELFIPILGLTFFNYVLRFGKWSFYLRCLGIRGLAMADSFLIFFAGLAMVITPGKVGEWLKSYLLERYTGVPFARTAPIVVAERLTDGLALLLLAAGGLARFGIGIPVAAGVVLLAASVVGLSLNRQAGDLAAALVERLPVIGRYGGWVREFHGGAAVLFRPRNLGLATLLGLVSWSGECLAFYLVLRGLGAAGGPDLAVTGAFILSVASLGSSLMLSPGGLGVAEGGITGLTQLLVGLPPAESAVAALLIRLGTLWFGVSIGTVALTLLLARDGDYLKGSSSSSNSSSSANESSEYTPTSRPW